MRESWRSGPKEHFVGLPDEETKRALDCSYVGDALTEDEYRNLGMPVPPQTEVTEEAILAFNRSEVRKVGVPGGGGSPQPEIWLSFISL